MSANPQNASPLGSAGRELLSLSYRIVPIMPKQKRPGEYVGGRWKAMDMWQRYRQQSPTNFELSSWLKWPNANIGIVLGSPCGDGTVVIAIDLDMRDPKQVARAVAALPATPMSKAGAKGETLFFRASPEIKTRVFDKILDELDDGGRRKRERLADLLAGGRQTVVPPSHHPDGFEYRWLRGPVPAADLPLFDDAALKRFEAVMTSLGWSDNPQDTAPPGVTRAPRPAAPRPSGDNVIDFTSSVHKRLNAAALASLDAWVPDLDLFKCQKARAGYEAVATWRPSSTGRPDAKRKRNLSIQPNGIEDFGAATKYSPLDLVMCAKGLTFNEAYEWLRGYITPADDYGVVLELEIPDQEIRPEKPCDDEDDSEQDLLRNTSPVKSAGARAAFFEADLDMREWPDELCYPSGLVGEFAGWITDTATKPCPILALGAAIVLVGTVAGRQFEGPTGTGTHLYVIGAAPTGAGKDHPIQCVSIALSDAGMANLIGPPDYTADSAVLKHLSDNPLSVSLMDEFGSIWKRINSKKSSTWETAITRALREPWGRSFALMRTKQYAGAGPQSQDIWWPALSILGMTTPGEFFNNLSAADIENGMANRFLLLATTRRTTDRRPRDQLKDAYFARRSATLSTPSSIVSGMKAIRNWQGETVGPQFAWPSTTRPAISTIRCEITRDAAELLFRYSQWIDEQGIKDEQFGKFYSRGAESAQRVGTIIAIGRAAERSAKDKSPPILDYHDVELAIRLVDWSLRTLWAKVVSHRAPSGIVEVSRTLVDILRRAGPSGRVAQRELRKELGPVQARDFEAAISYMQEAGISGSSPENVPGKRGPKTTWHWLIEDPEGQ